MASYAAVHRIIRVGNIYSGVGSHVRAEILQAVKPYGAVVEVVSDGAILRIEVVLTAGQDVTLVALMSGWASRLGLAMLDTTSTAVTAGH